MFKSKKAVLLLALVMLASFALTACGGGKVDTSTLVVAQASDATSLDPHAGNDQPSARVMRQVYDTLTGMDEDMNVYPLLAEEYKSVDPLTWEFKLKEGVKFHNGEEMKADDVIYSIERHLKSPSVSHILGQIDSVEKDGDYKVIIKTKAPFAAILRHLSHNSAAILNKKAVEEAGENYGQKPVGTGPYTLNNWSSGQNILLTRFEDYHGELAKTENIDFKVVPEATSRTIGLQTGEIGIAYDIDPIDVKTIEADDALEFLKVPSLSIDFLGMNNEKEPFNNPLVRQALAYAINPQEMLDSVMEGEGELAVSPLQKSVFGATTDVKKYEYNPEKAKQLLAEAGYPNGFKTSISTDDGAVRNRIAVVAQSKLKEIGIDATINSMEWGKYLDMTAKGEHEMFILGWSTNTGDADYGLAGPYLSTNHGDGGNRSFYTNTAVDKLIIDASHELDEAKRIELYKLAQQQIVEDVPTILLYHKNMNSGIQKNIKGYKVHPAGSHVLQNAYYDVEAK